MNPFVKSLLNWTMIVCVIIIALFLIVKGITGLVEYDKRVPDEFMMIKEEYRQVPLKKEDFPTNVTFDYSIKNNAPVIGENKYFVYGVLNSDVGEDKFYAVTKHDKAYTFRTGSKKGYEFEHADLFAVTDPFSFPKNAGKVSIRFRNYSQYKDFKNEVSDGENWRNAYEYVLKKQEKEKTK